MMVVVLNGNRGVCESARGKALKQESREEQTDDTEEVAGVVVVVVVVVTVEVVVQVGEVDGVRLAGKFGAVINSIK